MPIDVSDAVLRSGCGLHIGVCVRIRQLRLQQKRMRLSVQQALADNLAGVVDPVKKQVTPSMTSEVIVSHTQSM